MDMRSIALLCLSLAGCSAPPPPSDPQQPAIIIGRETDDPAGHLARMKAVIRQDAVTSYGAECGGIEVPDRAFIPVEITGGGLPELAVPFGRVICPDHGLNRFSGTGGVMVQFWIGSGGPVRLLLEQNMHGFTPGERRLVTWQHGGYCPDGAGPDQCRVTYAWDEEGRRFEIVERRLASTLPPETPRYGYELLSR
jgi:hypothetical protein